MYKKQKNTKKIIHNAIFSIFLMLCLFGISLLLISNLKQNIHLDDKKNEYNYVKAELDGYALPDEGRHGVSPEELRDFFEDLKESEGKTDTKEDNAEDATEDDSSRIEEGNILQTAADGEDASQTAVDREGASQTAENGDDASQIPSVEGNLETTSGEGEAADSDPFMQ